MSKRIALELSIGHTHGTGKPYYSGRQVKEVLADSSLPCTITEGEGIEDSSHSFEDTSVIKIKWDETIHGKVEVFYKRLSDFLGKVADEMHQRWVLLDCHAYSGKSMYAINISLNLKGFGKIGKNSTGRRSIQPDDLYNTQLVFRGTHTEPYDLLESHLSWPTRKSAERLLRREAMHYRRHLENSIIVKWIPFDGDIAHLGFTNLVPVGRRDLLQAISPKVGGRSRFTHVDLTARSLLYRSEKHFSEGMPALAFGCARLGEALVGAIDAAIRVRDTLLLILSKNAIASDHSPAGRHGSSSASGSIRARQPPPDYCSRSKPSVAPCSPWRCASRR